MSPDDKPVNAAPEEKAVSETKADGEERSAAEIRAEIEETRSELGDTVVALAAKTDVKAQAKAKVEDVKAKAKEAAPESPQEAQALVQENPKPFAIAAGVVVLFILWRWLRS